MMSLKSILAKPFAKQVYKTIQKWAQKPIETQEQVFKTLILEGAGTQFGKDHDFKNIQTHTDFVKRVPIRDYEDLKPYIERVVAGEDNILWKGKPLYFANRAQPRAQNTSLLPRKACHITLKRPEMLF